MKEQRQEQTPKVSLKEPRRSSERRGMLSRWCEPKAWKAPRHAVGAPHLCDEQVPLPKLARMKPGQ